MPVKHKYTVIPGGRKVTSTDWNDNHDGTNDHTHTATGDGGYIALGATGPTGPQGLPGADGAPGTQGPQGEQGLQGIPGNDGATGLPGDDGSQGIQGLPGNDGAPGTPGAKGDTGDTGPQGIQGIPGNNGADGATGPQGIQGIQGPQGNPGSDASVTKVNVEAVLTGEISSHTHAGGADPFTKLVLAADKPTGANVTPVTTGLVFDFEANSKYVIDIFAMVAPTAATTGCGFLIDTSVAVTYVATFVSHSLALTGTLSGSTSVGDAGVTANGVSSGMPATATYPVLGGGILISGANAGTATLFFRSETTAVTTLKAGTMVRIMKMA